MFRSLLAVTTLGLIIAHRAPAFVLPEIVDISGLNCIACHEASGEIKERLRGHNGPNLGTNGVPLNPHWLRKFLTDPSAEKQGTKRMPDMLHGLDSTKKAEAAEALTHFLVGIQPQENKPFGTNENQLRQGKRLFNEIGCAQCHKPQDLPAGKEDDEAFKRLKKEFDRTVIQNPPPLPPPREKYSVRALARFLQDPLRSRPHGRMPSQKLSTDEAEAIAAYLLKEQAAKDVTMLPGVNFEFFDFSFPELPDFDRVKPTSIGIAELFHPRYAQKQNDYALRFRGILNVPSDGEWGFWTDSDDGSQLLLDGQMVVDNGGVHLGQERGKRLFVKAGPHPIEVRYFDTGYKAGMTVKWEGPGVSRGEIEPKYLTHEARLMTPPGDAPFVLDEAKMKRGAELFAEYSCAKCHSIEQTKFPAELLTAKPAKAALPLEKIAAIPSGGCLANNPPATAPRFANRDTDVLAVIGQFVRNPKTHLDKFFAKVSKADALMSELQCFACHSRDQHQGAEGLLREYFTSADNVEMGDEGKIPPHLSGVGNKLRPEWLKEVIGNGSRVRPYMATRMPAFGKENAEKLAAAFIEADSAKEPEKEPNVMSAEGFEAAKHGLKLLGTRGLSCVACHNFNGNPSLGIPAVDLANSAQRLTYDWFRRYLLDPQALRPGTRMPAFWPHSVALNKDILGGDAEKQISAIWAFLSRKNFADLPDGVMRGKMELIPHTAPLIYRNFIEGAGATAIAVGYPEKANLAFDANEVRLAMIWLGEFIDASKHRIGRGEGFAKPLGRNVVNGPKGPAFAFLADEKEAWPSATGKTAGYQFHGYRFNQKKQPIFRYRYKTVEIEDHPVPAPGELDPIIRRTISLKGQISGGTLYLRAATGKITSDGDAFMVNEKLRMKFPGTKPILRGEGDNRELLVPVSFQDSKATVVQEFIW